MGNIIKSRLLGLGEADIQGVLNAVQYESDFYTPTYFPFRESPTFDVHTISMVSGLRISADVVSRGSRIQRKSREVASEIRASIPKIGIAREMDEVRLNAYQQLLAMTQGNSANAELVRFWADDVEFCARGVYSCLDAMSLQTLSTGKLILTNQNNVSVATECGITYPIASKLGVTTAWSDSANATPVDDLRTIVADALNNNIYLKYVFMSKNTLAKFCRCEQVIKLCASFAANALGIQQIPSLDQVNAALASLGDLEDLQIRRITQNITFERADGTRVTKNPFEDDVCTFVENVDNMGATYWVRPVETNLQGSAAIRTMRDCMLIKHWAEEEPVVEITQAVANAVPIWTESERSYLVDTENSSWSRD